MACVQGRVIGAAGPLHPCIPCIELYYQRYSHHFHSSEGLTSSFLPSDPLAQHMRSTCKSVLCTNAARRRVLLVTTRMQYITIRAVKYSLGTALTGSY